MNSREFEFIEKTSMFILVRILIGNYSYIILYLYLW